MATKLNLAEFPLFKDIPEELLDKVAALCSEETYAEEHLFSAKATRRINCTFYWKERSF